MRTKHTAVRPRMMLLLSLIAILAVGVGGSALAKGKAKSTSGVVYAGVTHQEGDDLFVAGEFKDKVLGRGAIVYITQITPDAGTIHVDAQKVTLYTTKGSMTGTGSADQTFNADGTSTISNGVVSLTKGTGAYAGHKFKGTFDGSYTDGVYTFNYEAKLK
jgi:hypothetical protein